MGDGLSVAFIVSCFEVIQFETFGGPQKTPSLNMIKTLCSLTSSNVEGQFI